MKRDEFFPLGEGYEKGMEYADEVQNKIRGRAAMRLHDYGILAQAIWNVGGLGIHLDIGTLYGVSAIMAALIKKRHFQSSPVVCVDFFDQYYGSGKDPITPDVPISVKVLRENLEMFDVAEQVIIIASPSYPAPLELSQIGVDYSTVLIDGDHKDQGPLNDFYTARRLKTQYVVFHDYVPGKPDVVSACNAVRVYPDWVPVHLSGATFVFEKKVELDVVEDMEAIGVSESENTNIYYLKPESIGVPG